MNITLTLELNDPRTFEVLALLQGVEQTESKKTVEKKAEPKKEKPAKKKEEVEKEEVEKEEVEKEEVDDFEQEDDLLDEVPTFEAVRTALRAYRNRTSSDDALALLRQHGFDKLADLQMADDVTLSKIFIAATE